MIFIICHIFIETSFNVNKIKNQHIYICLIESEQKFIKKFSNCKTSLRMLDSNLPSGIENYFVELHQIILHYSMEELYLKLK